MNFVDTKVSWCALHEHLFTTSVAAPSMTDWDKDRDAFILVLIDGDGMVFDDKLLSKGEAGGREAACLLWNSVTDYVHQNLANVPSDCKIVTRIYANLKGLGDVCHRSGLVEKPQQIEDFARGFTGSKQLFDFVDVGMGKDRADDKICGKFVA